MYEFIKGKLIDKTPTKAVVETFGIGYRIFIPLNVYSSLPAFESDVHLFLTQVVREDSNTLYGFLERDQRDLFEVLITISGIGPKTGIGILGHVEIETLERAIQTSDIKLLSKLPGIGKKTAERLVIEMRDKFKGSKTETKQSGVTQPGLLGDAMNALINLGYPPFAAQKAAQQAINEQKEEKDLGKIITSALKVLI